MAQRLNTVNQVLNQIGGECFKPIGTATTAAGLSANAAQTVGNMAETLKVAEALAQQAPANEPNFSGGAGPSAATSAIAGTAITAAVSAVNPMAGAALGVVGAIHAGLQSLKPSNQYYSLAQAPSSDKSANDSDFTSYKDIMGDTYTPAGRLQAPPANAGKMSDIALAAQKVSSENSYEDISDDIRTKFKEQLAMLSATDRVMKEKFGMSLGVGDPNLVADLGVKTPELAQQRARPSINIMGGPSFG